MTNENAINILRHLSQPRTSKAAFNAFRQAIEMAIEALKEPKRIRGKWNRLDMDTFNCNKCGATFVLNQGNEKMHFCPNCGAIMIGERDG